MLVTGAEAQRNFTWLRGFTDGHHVPILFYGWNVQPGSSTPIYNNPDIARPCLCALESALRRKLQVKPIQEIQLNQQARIHKKAELTKF